MTTAVLDNAGPVSTPGPDRVPLLRSDIQLFRGPDAGDGSPSWTLHDPARNLFIRLGWMEYEILSRWRLATTRAIATAVNNDTTLHVSPGQVQALAGFLKTRNLVISQGAADMRLLERQQAAGRQRAAGELLQKYLFFRFPLTRPDRFLSATAKRLDFVYSRTFAGLLGVGLLAGLFLTIRQWDSFTTTFSYLYSTSGIAWLAAALVLAKAAHELGHAWTAKRYGLRIPTMGIAFLVFWPVLYTDTTEAWKLTERRQRLAISGAGIAAEFIVAVLALLLWNILPDGPARSAVFVIATTSWVITLLVNSNPFVRFDGYYLLADYLDIPNLQSRAFELARWKLREWLFGPGDPAPGTVPADRQRLLIGYAWATWFYRLLLFTGIGLFVYHVLFKLAGIVLLTAVVGWFIVRPVCLELASWKALRSRARWNRHSITGLLLLLGGLLLLALPWNTQISAPAVARYTSYAHIYPPAQARIVAVHVVTGERVAAGQPLFLLDSPDLAQRQSQSERTIEMLRLQLARQATQASTIEAVRVLQSELARTLSELEGYTERREKLEITSPIAGTVVELTGALTPGRWVNTGLQLALVINRDALAVDAWLEEDRVGQVQAGDSARFYPDNPDTAPFDLVVEETARAALPELEEPFQASVYGGSIPVREQPDGTLVPNQAIYPVRLLPVRQPPAAGQLLTGEVRISGKPQSLLGRAWQAVVAVVIRESGF
ncbi:MAG: efflux RND transporter periplasmic adaptor subunit [Gammaproteobacteria bacterium]|jgi:putative peptide zinc metalloprotease protein